MFRHLKTTITILVLIVSLAGILRANPPVGDLDGNSIVNIQDLAGFANQWLGDPNGSANLNGDDKINMSDFALLAENWLLDHSKINLVINEFMADNKGTIEDPDEPGSTPDWIEIHNYGSYSIDIAGMWLTDEIDNPSDWCQIPYGFPEQTTIEAGGFLLIWADSEPEQGPLHVDFKLDADGGEDIGLFDEDKNPIDTIESFNAQEADESYGRFPDASTNWRTFEYATPGRSNEGQPCNIIISEIMYHPYHKESLLEPEPISKEFIELFNKGDTLISLDGWQFNNGVNFTFPNDVTIDTGDYLVVAANVNTFKAAYPSVNPNIIVGGWEGRLSNSGEMIELYDKMGVRIDEVRYADQGDWAVRELGPLDCQHRGWVWSNAHDGEGKSLELINPALSNEYGQNWTASDPNGGTPGTINSVNDIDIAPMILDAKHYPFIPGPNNPVNVVAYIIDEETVGIAVTLHYRVDTSDYIDDYTYPTQNPASYSHLAMFDDGAHDDEEANDGIYAAEIPAHPNNTVIEFYIEVSDGVNSRTWPAPSMMDGVPQQVTNALYQVNGAYDANAPWEPGSPPVYYLIMTVMERRRLEDIGSTNDAESYSHAEMNGTFISTDGVDIKMRYNVGIRNRGRGSRAPAPNNFRINFRNDQTWKGVNALIINSKNSYLQLLAHKLHQTAQLQAMNATAVGLRVNGENLALVINPVLGDVMYGFYVQLEVYDGDWADNHIPDDDGGNIYRCVADDKEACLTYEGEDPMEYAIGNKGNEVYAKRTNSAINDWNDLIELTRILDTEPDETYMEQVVRVVNINEWLRWFALQNLMSNQETSICNGRGDDYYMYRGIEDPRFIMLPYDMDSVFGLGQTESVGPYMSIWLDGKIVNLPVVKDFLTHPEVAGRFFWHFKDLIETVYSPENFDPFIERELGGWVPTSRINEMKTFTSERSTYVLSTYIPDEFSVNTNLPMSSGYPRSTSSTIDELSVVLRANPAAPRSVTVNGRVSRWKRKNGNWYTDGKWYIDPNITLNPGINRITVQTFDSPDGTGNEIERDSIDIWYDDGSVASVPNPLTQTNTVLNAASGPWYVSSNLIVPSGKTLTIEPGTTIYFNQGIRLTVQGRLVAQGTSGDRIRMTLNPASGSTSWSGIFFDYTAEDNRLEHVDMKFAHSATEMIKILYSQVLIDDMSWDVSVNNIIEVQHPSLIVRNSAFPDKDEKESIHGAGLSGNEYLIIEDNTFGTPSGTQDVIDFSDCKRPGPILQAYNNVFDGGGDDALDLDNTDAHIEGNFFTGFHNGNDGNDSGSTSNAIATDEASNINIARNIFFGCDHHVLLKNGVTITAQNNTFIGATMSSINFGEPGRHVDPGAGAYLDGNIFCNNNVIFYNMFNNSAYPGYGPDEMPVVNMSDLPSDLHYLGYGNIDADPLFVDPNDDFHLKPSSPAIATGPHWLDMGRYVPGGVAISGEPDGMTYQTTVTLNVGGPGITDYKYVLNDPNGTWSGELSIESDPNIGLTGLTNGSSYTVYVKGKNSAGVWQSDPCYIASRTWTVDTFYSRVVINEILAHTHGAAPDIIELYYDGPSSLDLTDMSLTDDPTNPRKFVFSSGTVTSTIMAPGEYKILYGDPNIQPINYLGFALSHDGEGLYLYDKLANGGGLVDSIVFGPQINNYSIGRDGYGQWKLNQMTFGSANIAQPTGNPAEVKINEWLANEEVLLEDDFIELYNPTSLPVEVSYLYLTDNPISQPLKHQLGPLSFVAPNGYAIFTADDTDGPGHLDFRLSADGGMIGCI